MNNKLLMGALAGAVTSFLLGFLIWGMFLMTWMNGKIMDGFYRAEDDMSGMWAAILSNLVFGLLYSWVIGKWAGSRDFMSGLKNGAVFGLILTLGYTLSYVAWTNYYTETSAMVMEVVVSTVMTAICGGVVGWVWGRGQTAE